MQITNSAFGLIEVVGTGWWPIQGLRKKYYLSAEDVESIRLLEKNWFYDEKSEITDRAIQRWVQSNCSSFWKIHDIQYTFYELSVLAKSFEPLTNPQKYAILSP